MSHRTIQLSFFIITGLILVGLIFFIFKPFLAVIFLSAVLAITFHPLYLYLLSKLKGRKNLASILTVCSMILFVMLPLAFLSATILQEAIDLYNKLTLGQGLESQISSSIQNFFDGMEKILSIERLGVDIELENHTRSVLNWVIGQADNVLRVIFDGIFKLILMLIAIHYLLLNGEKIKKIIIKWSPLPDNYDNEFINTLKSSVEAVIRGRMFVAIAQGLMLWLGFTIFGVANPVFWSAVGAIFSLVPIVGTAMVSVPAIAYLFFAGETGNAFGLLIWSAVCVGLLDDVLSFLFLKGRIRVHPLLVLFSILGGVELFGVIGFLVGPVVVSALVALAKIYPFVVPFQKSLKSEAE